MPFYCQQRTQKHLYQKTAAINQWKLPNELPQTSMQWVEFGINICSLSGQLKNTYVIQLFYKAVTIS